MIDKDLLKKTSGAMHLYLGDCFDFLKTIGDETIDLVITSPPYCMRKEYEDITDDIESFVKNHERILPEVIRKIKTGGSLCWQIGYHVKDSIIIPLDILVYNIIEKINEKLDIGSKLILRNRIIWTFGHGLNSVKRLSGRHEMILWFTKGNNYNFYLDEIRIPQKYPGKTHYKGTKKGLPSGNPLGKNPSDVWTMPFDDIWDIPNVKSHHVEKTEHPCQFPAALPIRLIACLTKVGDSVLDPFMGAGTTALASFLENRIFFGSEIIPKYFEITQKRINNSILGNEIIREDIPVFEPTGKEKVVQKPDYFR